MHLGRMLFGWLTLTHNWNGLQAGGDDQYQDAGDTNDEFLKQYEEQITKSKCSAACFQNGSCNEELGRCDCIKGRRGKDCSEVS